MKVDIRKGYAEQRRREYPSIGDQLDALWKMLDGFPLVISDETKAMMEQIKSVKTSIPKQENKVKPKP